MMYILVPLVMLVYTIVDTTIRSLVWLIVAVLFFDNISRIFRFKVRGDLHNYILDHTSKYERREGISSNYWFPYTILPSPIHWYVWYIRFMFSSKHLA